MLWEGDFWIVTGLLTAMKMEINTIKDNFLEIEELLRDLKKGER